MNLTAEAKKQLAAFERRISTLEKALSKVRRDYNAFLRGLRRRTANPKLSHADRKAAQERAAARARAGKGVGKGRGSVRSASTKRKLDKAVKGTDATEYRGHR